MFLRGRVIDTMPKDNEFGPNATPPPDVPDVRQRQRACAACAFPCGWSIHLCAARADRAANRNRGLDQRNQAIVLDPARPCARVPLAWPCRRMACPDSSAICASIAATRLYARRIAAAGRIARAIGRL